METARIPFQKFQSARSKEKIFPLCFQAERIKIFFL
jgi:hypothetical protein